MITLREAFGALWPTLQVLRRAFFSECGEDAVFLVALRPKGPGFYVDAGAFHPTDSSTTFKLYLKGWRGITIEPNPDVAPLFKRLRPRDYHLAEGVSSKPNRLTWYQYPYPKLNTLSAARAAHMKNWIDCTLSTTTIACRPLQAVLDEVCPGQHVDFPSVDCEGRLLFCRWLRFLFRRCCGFCSGAC